MEYLFDYFNDENFIVRKAKFIYDNSLFDGNGFIKWNYKDGFEVKLFTHSDEYKRPKVQGFGSPKVIKKGERQNIHFYLDGYKRGIIPSYYLGTQIFMALQNVLHFKSSNLILFQKSSSRNQKYWMGKGLFRLPKSNYYFPSIIETSEFIDGNPLNKSLKRNGIYYEEKDIRLNAWLKDDEYLEYHYSLKKEKYSQKYAIYYPVGFQNAISFLFGVNAKRLKTEVKTRNSKITEIHRYSDSEEMYIYNRLYTFQVYEADLVKTLADFFTKGYLNKDLYKESFVCSMILKQLIEAEKQKSQTTQELLTSTILEAVLRTLYDIPFGPTGKSISIKNYLNGKFRKTLHLDDSWDDVLEKVFQAHENMRHRNAHPDWLVSENDVYSDERISDTFHDLRILIKFYQQIILIMAGIKEVKPELPGKI